MEDKLYSALSKYIGQENSQELRDSIKSELDLVLIEIEKDGTIYFEPR
jgi:hypothetical protein